MSCFDSTEAARLISLLELEQAGRLQAGDILVLLTSAQNRST